MRSEDLKVDDWIAIAIRYAHHYDGPLESISAEHLVALERKYPLNKDAEELLNFYRYPAGPR